MAIAHTVTDPCGVVATNTAAQQPQSAPLLAKAPGKASGMKS